MQLISKRPQNKPLPTFSEMAQLLVKAVPVRDRSQAYTLLITQILPQKLNTLPTHPEPRRLVKAIYESLADALQQARPNQRLHALRAVLCDTEIRQLDIESLTMAVARYMKDYPDVTEIALDWLDSRDVSRWLAMSKNELEVEAQQRLEQLKRWDKFAKRKHPSIWENYRIWSLHIELNLGAAKTGIFLTAMGSLAYFLETVGADYDELRLF